MAPGLCAMPAAFTMQSSRESVNWKQDQYVQSRKKEADGGRDPDLLRDPARDSQPASRLRHVERRHLFTPFFLLALRSIVQMTMG